MCYSGRHERQQAPLLHVHAVRLVGQPRDGILSGCWVAWGGDFDLDEYDAMLLVSVALGPPWQFDGQMAYGLPAGVET